MEKFISHSHSQTERIAVDFASKLTGGDVVAFKGDLGAGKTFFTSAAVKSLGVSEEPSSPTFAIVNDYGIDRLGRRIYHFDMYRVETWDDLYSVGFFDYLTDDSIIFLEWSENIEEALPEEHYTIEINKLGETDREFLIYGGGK